MVGNLEILVLAHAIHSREQSSYVEFSVAIATHLLRFSAGLFVELCCAFHLNGTCFLSREGLLRCIQFPCSYMDLTLNAALLQRAVFLDVSQVSWCYAKIDLFVRLACLPFRQLSCFNVHPTLDAVLQLVSDRLFTCHQLLHYYVNLVLCVTIAFLFCFVACSCLYLTYEGFRAFSQRGSEGDD